MPTGLFDDIVQPVGKTGLFDDLVADTPTEESPSVLRQIGQGATPKGLVNAIGQLFTLAGQGVSSGVNAAVNLSARMQGLPEYGPGQELFQAGRPTLPIPAAHSTNTPAILAGALQMAEGLTTPENLVTMPLAMGRAPLQRAVQGAFASQMIPAAIESGQIAMDPSVPSRRRFIEGTKGVIGSVLSAGLAKGATSPTPKPVAKEFVSEGPIRLTPDDIASMEANVDVVAPSRQLPLRTYQGPTYVQPNAGGARFVQDPLGQTIDLSQLTGIEGVEALRGPRVFTPREEMVRPSQQVPPVIGEQGPQRQVFYEAPQQEIITPTVIGRPPVEPSGGEISFRSPAAGYSIPSARQTKLTEGEPSAKEIPQTKIPIQETGNVRTGGRGESGTSPQQPSEQVGIRDIRGTTQEGKPEVAKLAPAGSGRPNKLGDPLGTTYHATEADFARYNEIQSEFKRLAAEGKGFDDAGMVELFRENETIKNKYGGMPPQAPKSVEPSQGSKLYSAPGMLFDPKFYKETAKGAKTAVSYLTEKYAEPLLEVLGRKGGPTSKKVTEEAGQIISRHKELYGELTPTLDKAKKQLGSMTGAGTQWTRKLNEVTEGSAFNNFFGALEKATPIPAGSARAMRLASDANLEGGRMAQRANPGFIATGKPQRMLTSVGYDVIVKGGKALDDWAEGMDKLNNKPAGTVKKFFDKWGQDLRDPGASVARLEAIAQDFTREFPRTITHVKTPTGWHEVVIADPFNYLESMAQRISSATAFRETYPLVKDPKTGKWISSGIVEASREAVKKEGGDVTAYDNLMRTLQGHPLDTFKGSLSSVASTVGSTVGSPLKALMLSANLPVNMGELLSGAPQIFLGYRNFGQAVKELAKDGSLLDQLELSGARNKAMVNMAFDPSSPARSVARITSGAIRKGTGQQFLNEVQEAMAALSAKVYADRIKAKEMSQGELNRAREVFRAMGFNKAQADAMTRGDAKLLSQFETKAAAWLTGGNKAKAEMSRLGVSRIFNSAFWFHTYPQTRINQLRSVGRNLIDDVGDFSKNPSKKTWTPVYHNAALMGRQLGGGAMQGAITLGTLALISGGIYGLSQAGKDAKEDTAGFVKDTIVSAYGGPLTVLNRLAQNVQSGDSVVKEITSLSPPVTVAKELYDMGLKTGRYEGLDTGESIAKFLESKTPAAKAFKTGMAVFGLSETDLELQTAIKAFYKWRREQPGFKQGSGGGGTEEQIELRTQMKKVKKALEDGSDWVAELRKVSDLKAASRSLQAGTLLEVNGKALSTEQQTALRNRIGDKLVDKLMTRDAMIREVARTLNEKTPEGEKVSLSQIKQPTGQAALDRTTQGQRQSQVSTRLSEGLRSYLQSNEVTGLSYTPSITMPGKKETLLDSKQAKIMEDLFVTELERLVGPLVTNRLLNERSLAQRQTIIQSRIEGARKLAEARMRRELQSPK